MSNVSSLSAKKFERHTINLLFKETRNCESSRYFRYSFFFANYFSISIFIYLILFSFSLRDAHPRSRFRSRSSIDHGLWFQIFPRVAHLTSISSHLSRAFVIPASTPLFPPLVRTLHGPSSFLVPCIPFVWPRSIFARFHGYGRYIESRTRGEHLSVISPSKFGIPPSWNNNNNNRERTIIVKTDLTLVV